MVGSCFAGLSHKPPMKSTDWCKVAESEIKKRASELVTVENLNEVVNFIIFWCEKIRSVRLSALISVLWRSNLERQQHPIIHSVRVKVAYVALSAHCPLWALVAGQGEKDPAGWAFKTPEETIKLLHARCWIWTQTGGGEGRTTLFKAQLQKSELCSRLKRRQGSTQSCFLRGLKSDCFTDELESDSLLLIST